MLRAVQTVTDQLDALQSELLSESVAAAGAAAAEAKEAELAAYAGVAPEVLVAQAVQQLAANLPRIESLVLTPDLLAPVLAKLGAR